ncbi:MAG: AarF/UbiB family protein, partial [Rickettsiales bacterium]|nr:AarF/UbiB family protein [Rickettsiales bacterium]
MRFFANFCQLFRITYTLASYRLLTPATESKLLKPFIAFLYAITPNNSENTTQGKRLAIALEKLGPSFIKLGQTLSARPDIVGQETAQELSLLQDKLAPFGTDKAIEEIETELSDTIDNLYSEFGKTAVAAASIAQVHKAVTKDGKDVAVKILRPDIEKKFKQDIDFLFCTARIIETIIPSSRRLKPVSVVEILAESVKIELDLRFEAAAASELKDNSAKDHGIYIPSIDWERTSRRVMTIEWIDGIHIHDTEKLIEAGHDLTEISNKLAVNFFNQAYRDGFFHADMHPGNLFVNAKGDIVPIDFGIMGRLDKRNRLAVAEILEGFLTRNYRKTAQIHIDVGYVPANTSVDLFAQACRSIGEPIVGLSSSKISITK